MILKGTALAGRADTKWHGCGGCLEAKTRERLKVETAGGLK